MSTEMPRAVCTSTEVGRRPRNGRNIRQRPPIGPQKADDAVRRALDAESVFVDCTMMSPAQQDQIVETCTAAIRPVGDVVRITVPQLAAREATMTVAVLQRPANGRWHGPRATSCIDRGAVLVVHHEHVRRVARDTS